MIMNSTEERFVTNKLYDCKERLREHNLSLRRLYDKIDEVSKKKDLVNKDIARLKESLATGIYNP